MEHPRGRALSKRTGAERGKGMIFRRYDGRSLAIYKSDRSIILSKACRYPWMARVKESGVQHDSPHAFGPERIPETPK